jgi:tRNA (guanine-N7-)-methyltransferase
MRLRYVKNARELIEGNPQLIFDNKLNEKIDIDSVFSIKQPIHIEIGMGKGKFIYTLAKLNPEINFIGIEKFDSAIVKALQKVMEEPLDNLFLLRADAIDLKKLFNSNSFDRIYLNFSDPWPKDRHAKRRLTHRKFLKMYQELLPLNGEIHFKTDNINLFNYSVESIKDYPMEIISLNYDLHSSDNNDNIMTEFEEKFSKQGFKINKLVAKFKEEQNG